MKRGVLFLTMSVATLLAAGTSSAVIYPFHDKAPIQVTESTPLKIGSHVYLFFAGAGDGNGGLKISDVLLVYRQFPAEFALDSREVGKVKILGPLGDYYIKGEVVGGDVRPGDLAKKGTAICYITSLAESHTL